MPQSPTPTPAPRRRKKLLLAALLAAGAGTVAATGSSALIQGLDGMLPDARRISTFSRPGTVTVLSADGQVLQKLGPATREKVANGQMPLLVQRAFIAAEDRRFYQHNGVDAVGIGRAVITNLTRGSVQQGASTITQQLARVVFLTQDRTLLRKLKEAALAFKLERQLSKKQILEQYLNYVYLGSSAYGVADASWVYFSKSPNQLTLPEAALIAGLPPAPSVYSPLVNPQLALERRAVVLRRMREAGFIDDAQLARANGAPLHLKPALPKHWNSAAPYFTSFVAQELPKVLTPEQLEVGGLTIRSSLNLGWQNQAQKVINANTYGDLEGALVSMEPGTGLVRAMVGGRDFEKSQFNRATQALRQPGSTFKLMTYLVALERGLKPGDPVGCDPVDWGGQSFSSGCGGSLSLSQALAISSNTAALRLGRRYGLEAVVKKARDLGITTPLAAVPGLVLGQSETRLMEMTAAYGAIANDGLWMAPTTIRRLTDAEPCANATKSCRQPSRTATSGRRVIPPGQARLMQGLLRGVVQGGTGTAASLGGQEWGKTGTTNEGRDLLFIGYEPSRHWVMGIWLGNDDSSPSGGTSGLAAQLWGDIIRSAGRGSTSAEAKR